MKLFLTFTLALLCLLPMRAQSLDEVESLMAAGNYGEAQEMLDYLIASTKSNNAGALNLLAGECAQKLNDPDAARNYFNKAAQRGVADAHLQLGRMDMAEYDFPSAREHYNKYVSLKQKAGKDASEGEMELERSALASDMLDRVEKLEIIDVVEVPRDKVLTALALSPQAGSCFIDENGNPGFLSSDKRLRYTTAPYIDSDSTEYTRIYEQTLLLSGKYDEPQPILDEEQACFPFMMPDGCTFYFASTREGGIGGLDIYRSNRDSEDGTFMGAVNMGMPYNSPADDYMLAIDEYTGVGWLLTARGHEEDGLASAYIFIPKEIRENYPADTEDIVSLAKLENIEVTQDSDKDYSPLLKAVEALRTPAEEKTPQYSFTMPDGKVITSFPDEKSRHAMKQYATNLQSLEGAKQRLAQMRELYGNGRTDLRDKILQAEGEIESLRRTTKEQKQRLIKILQSR